MYVSRFARTADGRRAVRQSLRLSILSLVLLTTGARAAHAADDVAGSIVDQSGRPVPRASIVAVDAAGMQLAGTFADEAGRFTLTVPATAGCRVTVSLTGFQPATVACGPAASRIVLAVAPIEETVVVTATRTEAPAAQVGSSVTVFSADEIERRQAPQVADLLRSSPGAMVVRTGALGGVTSLFVRGGESSYNKVLLDGIPLNEPGGTFNFSNVTSEGLQRVEIVRGAQSALFGSDAMSSVVQMFTARGDRSGPARVSGVFEGGTYSTARGSAQVSGGSGAVDYAVGAAGITTDNRVPNNAYRNTTLLANVGVAVSDTATLRVIARAELEKTGTPGQTAYGRPDMDAFFQRHDGVGGVTFDQQVTPRFRQRASYSLSASNQQSTNLIADPPYTPSYGGSQAPFEFFDYTYDTLNDLRRHHASYQADWRLANDSSHGSQLLTFLADWDGERADLRDRLAGTLTSPSRNNVGWSVQHQAVWQRVSITAGARVEHNDSFGTSAVPRGSVAFVVHRADGTIGETTVRASAGLGIKEPTLLQSFSPSPYYRGNPDLLPERSRTVEAGVEQRLANNRVKVDLAWFDNRYSDLIGLRTTNPATFEASYYNIGLTTARGLETTVEVAPTHRLHGQGGYTFLDSDVVDSTSPSSPVFLPGQTLFRRPRHSGYAGAAWRDNRLSIDLYGVFIGSYVDSDLSSLVPPIVTNPGYTTWDARVSYKIVSQLSVTGAIDNLGNADYQEPLGYPALQRAFRIGLRVEF